ncbi:TRAP transporter small permease [Chakrabartyella piscis]|uniref:TRAP transporter small permease n=1 Tax=Chakrabartyella piscis TaxID=2918914 RepID=UPI00295844F0|nr:TRAP transporter small permease [Chakrabartyella piscis]
MKKLGEIFNGLLNITVIIFVIGMVIVTFLQVIFRFALNNPLSWSEELARCLFVWVTFLGAAICARENAHIGMDYLVSKLPQKLAKGIGILGFVLIIIVCIAIAFTSFDIIAINMNQKSAALKLNMGMVYTAIPIGFAYMIVYYMRHLITIIKSKEAGEE